MLRWARCPLCASQLCVAAKAWENDRIVKYSAGTKLRYALQSVLNRGLKGGINIDSGKYHSTFLTPLFFLHPYPSVTCKALTHLQSSCWGISCPDNIIWKEWQTLFWPVICLIQVFLLANVISPQRRRIKYFEAPFVHRIYVLTDPDSITWWRYICCLRSTIKN